jgi:hypothetical protein
MSDLAVQIGYGHRWRSVDNDAVNAGNSAAGQVLPSDSEESPTSPKGQANTYESAQNSIKVLLAQRVPAGSSTERPIERGTLSVSQTAPPQSVPRVRSKEKMLQEWEGRIIALGGGKLVARLVDVTAGQREELEEMEFPLSELPDDDRKIARVGSIFRLIIGWRYDQGTRSRVTNLFLRRLPMWRESEMRRADEAAKVLVDALKWG